MAKLDNYDNDTFYLAFKDAHPSWSLIGCAAIFGITASFGILFHLSVIFVTIKTKSLNGTVNYLLALCSFFELLHLTGHFLFVYNALSGQNFVEYRLAAMILFIPVIGLGGINSAMLFTGIDRLIVLIFGEIQNKRKIRLYLTTIIFICSIFCIDLCYTFYQNIELYGDQMITGNYIDFFMHPNHQIAIYFCLNLMTIIIYLFVGIVIKMKSAGLPSVDQINYRTFRALSCIIIVNIGGYFISALYAMLIRLSISSPITAWFGQAITGIPLLIGAASNGPILYFTSTEYRQAFQTEFQKVFRRNVNQNQVAPQPNVPPPVNLNTTR